VARDARVGRRMTSRIRGVAGLTALTDTQVTQTGSAERVVSVKSQRLLVLWPAFTGLDAEQQRVTVAHELTHAALAPVTSGRVPAWLGEGIAMYVSGDRRTVDAAQALTASSSSRVPSLRTLSRPDAVARLGGREQAAAYAYASAAAFYVADHYGRRRLMALYDAFNRDDVPGAEGDPATVDAATRKVLHVSLATLDRRVRSAAGA
jgi:hypothetical protein